MWLWIASKTFYCRTFVTKRLRNISTFTKMNTSSAALKPPNILVYTGEKREELYKNFVETLYKCLHVDKYVIYQLKSSQVLTTPWKENAVLLIVCYGGNIENCIVQEFVDFVKEGGKLLVLCSNFNVDGCKTEVAHPDFITVKYKESGNVLLHGNYSYTCDNCSILAKDDKHKPVILKTTVEKGILITSSVQLVLDSLMINSLSKEAAVCKDYCSGSIPILKSLLTEEFGLERISFELPKPSPGYVFVSDDIPLEDLMKQMSISEISIEKRVKPPGACGESSDLKVPLFFEAKAICDVSFDKQTYFTSLKTDYFGKTVVFFPVVTSTMNPAEHLSDYPGLVVIANRQLSGKGRGDNVWLSPEGSAMFTLHFPLMLSSRIGQRLSIVQHMSALAVVHGLRRKAGFSDIDLCLKWPNDIYYGKDKKIGGVIVNTTIQGDVVHVFVGIGVNVANKHPTICINNIIETHNSSRGESLLPLKTEEVIASTLTELEQLIEDFKKSGPDKFFDLYYNYWVHKDQRVSLADLDREATVQGIDEYGFLIVKSDDGKRFTLQPDGNRFDMMKNLIITKNI